MAADANTERKNPFPRHLEKEKEYGELQELFKPHIDSFDYMVESGLKEMVLGLKPIEVFDLEKKKLTIWFENPVIFSPLKKRPGKSVLDHLYPFECRQANLTYAGKFVVDIKYQYDNCDAVKEQINLGQFPIMLKSKSCHLKAADAKRLVSLKEEPNEMGGYFILNGLERVVRLLILHKRNYPMSVVRKSFCELGSGYTDKAVVIRCVREDESAVTVKLYYFNNGSARLGFWVQRREYLLPVGIILKALLETTDQEIYKRLTCCKYGQVRGSVGTQFVGDRAIIMLNELQSLSLKTRAQCLKHIGEHFQPLMVGLEKESYSVIGDAVLRDYIFVHLDDNIDKFNLLIFMLQKLFSFVDQTSVPDNIDSLQNHEVLLPGHLLTVFIKEKLQDFLLKMKNTLQDEVNDEKKKFDMSNSMLLYPFRF